jgi:diamine N-acetyltransferase
LEVRDAARGSVDATGPPPLRGDAIRLRAVGETDLPLLVRWLNDPDVRHWLHQSDRPDATVDSVRARFGLVHDGFPNLVWVIETLEGRAVGRVGLIEVDPYHRRAELGISIGEKDCWSRGYGTDAIRAVLRHAFEELGLRRVGLITDADNARGIRCYEKCGFVPEGFLREHRLRYGEPLDMIAMGALRDEWVGLEGKGQK